jgi:hypothetical protein
LLAVVRVTGKPQKRGGVNHGDDSSSSVVLDIKGEVMKLVPIHPLPGTALVVHIPAGGELGVGLGEHAWLY